MKPFLACVSRRTTGYPDDLLRTRRSTSQKAGRTACTAGGLPPGRLRLSVVRGAVGTAARRHGGTAARRHGAWAFALNSATGADPSSRFFYNRVKGEVEAAVRQIGFPSLTIVRPALIGGDRDEFRPAESVAMRLLRLAQPLLPRRYRVVPHERIASVLFEAAATGPLGEHITESDVIVGGTT